MSNTASLKKEYVERIAPALKSQFQYTSSMQVPVLKKIVINQGLYCFCKFAPDAFTELFTDGKFHILADVYPFRTGADRVA